MIHTKDTFGQSDNPPALDTYSDQELAAVLEALVNITTDPYTAQALAAGAHRVRELSRTVNAKAQP